MFRKLFMYARLNFSLIINRNTYLIKKKLTCISAPNAPENNKEDPRAKISLALNNEHVVPSACVSVFDSFLQNENFA